MELAREPLASERWLQRDERALAGVLKRATDIVAVSGEGSWLIDADGRRWLDLASGIAVNTLGHCHPRVVEAIERQARTLIHTSVTTHHTQAVELAERIGARTPVDDPRVFFCNTGAEAVDGSLKLARQATGKPGIVAFRGAFHGRTLAATSITTAKPMYQQGYEPLLPDVHIAPYGGDLDALDVLLGPSIGAMIVEPVLGEGGYVVPPREWLAALRERCDAYDIVLIFDEVQCGVARTGRFFAAETFGVTPDVILFAKGIASGLPLGGIVAGRELMDAWPPGAHGSTFGGNPVSCAAAQATLDVIDEEDLCGRARFLGEVALHRLRAVDAPHVAEVRGIGLMVGVELVTQATCAEARERCLDDGLLVLSCGPADYVLRLIPPLTITADELEQALSILERALADRTSSTSGLRQP